MYNLYYFFYFFVYNAHPYFDQDYYLAKEVAPIFLSSIGIGNALNYFLFVLLALGCLVAFYFLCRFIIQSFLSLNVKKRWKSLVPFLGLILFSFFFSSKTNEDISRLKTVQWTTPRIIKSLFSNQEKINQKLSGQYKYEAQLANPLQEKPNVYFIFLEAYGSVVSLGRELGPRYDSLLSTLEPVIQEKGWHCSSNYSISPVIGGRSWLSFSSVMAGIELRDHVIYNDLIHNYKTYPHLIEYFNRQGYESSRMNTFKGNEKTEILISYEALDSFWKFDNRYGFKDFPYKGYDYDVFGGIPDQYALGYFQDSLRNAAKPSFMFFITMNSHGPWFEPAPLLEDWRALDSIKVSPHGKWHAQFGMNIERYYKCMEYQLKMSVDFITEKSR